MDGRSITTVEAFDNGPGAALDPIQQAFAETGAIQCGYCTPAMVLAARQLLSAEPNPTEAQVRDVLGLQIGDGTAQVSKLVISRHLLGREFAP